MKCFAALALIIAWTAPGAAQTPQLEILGKQFQTQLEQIAQETPGVVGVTVVDMASGARYTLNEGLVFAQGSAIKVPVLLELFRQAETGRIRLDDRLPLRNSEKAGGSGVLQYFGNDTSQLALRDLAVLMIVLSDNTATNLLIQQVGMENVNRTMQEIGLANTRLQRMMIRPQDSAAGRENISTPAEAAELMGRIARCELPVSREHCAEMKTILGIPREEPLSSPIPDGIPVFWKSGGLVGVSTAWAFVDLPGWPYVLAVMVNYGDEQAPEAVRRISEAAYRHFALLAGATQYGTRVPLHYLTPDTTGADR